MRRIPLLAAVLLGAAAAVGAEEAKNGFLPRPSSIPPEEILAAGPPRDGIPALVDPPRIAAEAAPWNAEEWIVGVARVEEAAAYPVSILEWHELVNDTLGGQPILVSYCPLCGTAMVFDRRIDGRARTFGVSGLLFKSNLLLYDRETQSLWSQMQFEAVTGPSLGERLVLVRSRMMRWAEWRALHPGTSVLSPETRHRRPYGRSPYGDYATSVNLRFPAPLDRRYHPKTPTLGLRLAKGPARAYPAVELVRAGGTVEERFGGRDVRITYDPERESFSVEAPPDVGVIEGYWFAWMAFHPNSSVFSGGGSGESEARR